MRYEFLILLIPVITSFLATVFSISALFVSKRRIYTDIITSSRLKWINSLREKINEFIIIYYEEYSKPTEQRTKLTMKQFEIELFFNYTYNNDGYKGLKKCLSVYLEYPENHLIKNHDDLIIQSQHVLDAAFVRAKEEAGISKIKDKKRRKAYTPSSVMNIK